MELQKERGIYRMETKREERIILSLSSADVASSRSLQDISSLLAVLEEGVFTGFLAGEATPERWLCVASDRH